MIQRNACHSIAARLALIVCILVASFATSAVAATLPTLGAAQNAQVMRGQFTQKKYLAELDQPLVSTGHYVVARNRGLLWAVEKPVSSQLVITPDNLVERSNGQQTAHLSARQQPALGAVASILLAAFQGNVDQLRQYFDVMPGQNSADGWVLTLVPKTAAVRQFITRLHIRGEKTVRWIRIDQPGGDHSVITLMPATDDPPQLSADEQAAFSR